MCADDCNQKLIKPENFNKFKDYVQIIMGSDQFGREFL